MTRYSQRSRLVLLFLISGLMTPLSRAAQTTGQNLPEKDLLKAFHTISSHDLMDYVVELTSKKYNGRMKKNRPWMTDCFGRHVAT